MAEYVLEMRNITKEFPGVKALDNVSFKVKKGEIHALCGENGAGKSTLMKVLSGLYPEGIYKGQILIDGIEQKFKNIREAEEAGIAIIYQELALVKQMTVGENIFLGVEPGKYGLINWDELYSETKKWLARVGLKINPMTKVDDLGIGQQQLVEIAKALSKKAKILILDEPTAALTEGEVEILMDILNNLRKEGVTCIYISHKLNEVFQICDTVTVLRDGKSISTTPISETDEDTVIAQMVGRELTERFPSVKHEPGETVLEVENLRVFQPDGTEVVKGVSFQARKGEILGISGLMGAGRTEVAMALFGGYHGKWEGKVKIDGKEVKIKNPYDAINKGLALVSEDRKRYGLVLDMDVKQNIMLSSLKNITNWFMLNFNEEIKSSEHYKDALRIKIPSLETKVRNLSGGNQQKVVFGKWLMTRPKVLILDEPTRGIDIGAKYEIYNIMHRLVDEGVAVIMISSELPEILGMSDRILVMNEGRIVKELSKHEATQEKIMKAATGGE
ncbi:D-xylose transport system ATP-binding protein [Caldalkalibacillus uzonensis]|uniref:D-xylose transport system ATP-binding protein n=1 Tax=Caldalkalibacillus uzonensis TaxID=353224 RepID=A0ABU0CU96_9BACI|nr:xylose ABC transporter ATP-binding protein [Caldalkalibacillus uzonensis]MDQ0338597.1 D-xylose transport system ATP-binding protein [Caldalkalibacillus uzonensis]